jgi:excisionase family DNA binding protein
MNINNNPEQAFARMARESRMEKEMEQISSKFGAAIEKALTPLYTVSEVTEYLQVSPSTVYRMVQDGRLVGMRLGNTIRFTPDNLAQMIKSNTVGTY